VLLDFANGNLGVEDTVDSKTKERTFYEANIIDDACDMIDNLMAGINNSNHGLYEEKLEFSRPPPFDGSNAEEIIEIFHQAFESLKPYRERFKIKNNDIDFDAYCDEAVKNIREGLNTCQDLFGLYGTFSRDLEGISTRVKESQQKFESSAGEELKQLSSKLDEPLSLTLFTNEKQTLNTFEKEINEAINELSRGLKARKSIAKDGDQLGELA